MNDLLTLGEVAIILRVSKSHMSKLTRGLVQGIPPLPTVRLGRRVIIERDALIHWISQHCNGSVHHKN
jgi:hypothetical protein